MKYITIMLILVSTASIAQIRGNKEIETKSFEIENVETIKINFYSDVLIDVSKKEGLTITIDNNLFDHIDKEVVDGVLSLDQIKWIQPSEKPKIIIGAPYLKALEQGTHDTTKIINLDTDSIRLMALMGTIIAEGKTKTLNIGAEIGKVDASNLNVINARVDIWNRGSAKVNVQNELDSKLSPNAKLLVMNTPKLLKGDAKEAIKPLKDTSGTSTKYIRFRIKNNSLSRKHFFVVGPKPDGSKFGYGFPMMPQAIRKENWTVGTKIYSVNSMGFRKLLRIIKIEDKNKIVKLF